MSLLKASKFVSKLTTYIPKRNVSEYAKRFGYVLKERKYEYGPNTISTIFYLAGAAYLIYDVAMDKQKHFEVFMEQYDENKNYLKPRLQFDKVNKPNMDFLVDNVFLPEPDEIEEPAHRDGSVPRGLPYRGMGKIQQDASRK